MSISFKKNGLYCCIVKDHCTFNGCNEFYIDNGLIWPQSCNSYALYKNKTVNFVPTAGQNHDITFLIQNHIPRGIYRGGTP